MRLKARRSMLVLIGVVFLSSPVMPVLASVQNDQVLSQHIKEADGTSGQNTNSGSGVKTGHIQDGAVTDAKITGPISASKVPHNHDGVYERKYANVVIVSKDGNGDFTDPVSAMASITGASASNPYLVKIMPGVYDVGTSSVVMKQYVDIEGSGESVTKITGQVSTPINDPAAGVVSGANNSQLRQVTIENTGAADYSSVGIFNDGVSPSFSDISVIVVGSEYPQCVFSRQSASPTFVRAAFFAAGGSSARGVVSSGSSVTLKDVSISFTGSQAAGYGISNWFSTCVVSDSTISGHGYGISNSEANTVVLTNVSVTTDDRALSIINPGGTDCSIVVHRSTLNGGVDSVYGYGFEARFAVSQLGGALSLAPPNQGYPPSSLFCVGAYDTDFSPLTASCQPQP